MDVIARIENLEEAITVPQLALILGCSEKLLYSQISTGRIPSFRVGSLIRLNPAEIAVWLRSHQIVAPPRKRDRATGGRDE